jgi:hypothetical protein
MKDIEYNILAEHLFSKMYKDGNQFRLLSGIIGHRRNGNAVEKKIKCGSMEKEMSRRKLFLDGRRKLNGVMAERHGLN